MSLLSAPALSSPASPSAIAPSATPSLLNHYQQVRAWSDRLCRPLETEDYAIQTMADVSPPKWHLAHVSWFFETFLLGKHWPDYRPFHPDYNYCFNSYYEALGDRHPRPQRGLLSRPTVRDIYAYRQAVDEAMAQLIVQEQGNAAVEALVVLGLHHEQQHQELLLMDIKHILATNPLRPVYRADLAVPDSAAPDLAAPDLAATDLAAPGSAAPSAAPAHSSLGYQSFSGGLVEIGLDLGALPLDQFEGFAFDNEGPRHRVYLEDFSLADRLVTNGEYLEFIEAGGYRQPQHWLAEGWAKVQQQGWSAPLYWEQRQGSWWVMTLGGLRVMNPAEPVCHVSGYEADAFARWAGQRLPTEAEWERAASVSLGPADFQQGNFVEQDLLHPRPAPGGTGLRQLLGDVWEWTQSSYGPYPGYRPAAGAIGEYNGKFMCNQLVLRGGSCATAHSHIRSSYRNFFPPEARWLFGGIRLAR